MRALSLIRALEVRPIDGTYVSSLAPDLLLESTRMTTDLLPGHSVLELFEVRRVLEPGAVALAAQRMDADAKPALRHCGRRVPGPHSPAEPARGRVPDKHPSFR